MDIDINSYVDRYMNSYIFYDWKDFEATGDINKIDFHKKYNEARTHIHEAALQNQANALVNQNKQNAPDALIALDIAHGLSEGNTLEIILESIADSINQGIDSAANSIDYAAMVVEGYSYKDLLQQGLAKASRIKDFLNLIMQGVTLAGNYDKSFILGLRSIGSEFSGSNNFAWGKQWLEGASEPELLTQDELEQAAAILKTLNNAGEILRKNQVVGTKSFEATIKNIFSTALGENIAKIMLINAVNKGLEVVDDRLFNSGLKLTWLDSAASTGGTRKDIAGTTSKVDVFRENALELSYQVNGQSAKIEIGTNLSVKWYAGLYGKSSGDIHIVSRSPITTYLQDGTPDRYVAYNIFTHRRAHASEVKSQFDDIRSFITASFLSEWVMGSGLPVAGKGTNTAQFLMVNGKVYSVMRIINNICRAFEEKENNSKYGDGTVSMDIPMPENTWETTISKAPNVYDAIRRSQLINEVVNKIVISARMNINMLAEYAEA